MIVLFAMTDVHSLAFYGSATLGVAVAALAGGVLGLFSRPRLGLADVGVFEFQRRALLREGSSLYRWFEHSVDWLAAHYRQEKPESLAILKRNIYLAGIRLPWKPEEYLAVKFVETIAVALGTLLFVWALSLSFLTAFLCALVVGFAYLPLVKRQVRTKAELYLHTLRRRLPFVIDLTALTMEAGASFLESITIAVKENENHPIGKQFAEVLRDISTGRTRREALEALQERLGDENITEIVTAIIKGEELGTPLSKILRSQVDQIRLKRSQWAEKAAAEAQVNIVFPGMIVMISCLIIVVAPFVLGPIFMRN